MRVCERIANSLRLLSWCARAGPAGEATGSLGDVEVPSEDADAGSDPGTAALRGQQSTRCSAKLPKHCDEPRVDGSMYCVEHAMRQTRYRVPTPVGTVRLPRGLVDVMLLVTPRQRCGDQQAEQPRPQSRPQPPQQQQPQQHERRQSCMSLVLQRCATVGCCNCCNNVTICACHQGTG